MKNPTPVTITEKTFTNRENETLSVTSDSEDAYKAPHFWKDFKVVTENKDCGNRLPSGGIQGVKIIPSSAT